MSSPTQVSAKPKTARIALFGAFGVGNLGNECTLQALLYNIRKHFPDAQISCICPGPDEVRRAYNISARPIEEIPLLPVTNPFLRFLRKIFIRIPVELLRWVKAIAALRNTDILIMTGTGMLGDFGIGPLGLHYEILKWAVAAKLCRCKAVFLSVGAGPLRHSLSRRLVRAALSCADYRSFRDGFSKNYMQRIGFDRAQDFVFPDLAFSFPAALLPQDRNHRGNKAVVGVGLMTYFNRTGSSSEDESVYITYIAKMASFVSWLLEKKYTVRLLIGDVSHDQRATRDLIEYIQKSGITYERGRIIDEPAATVEEVLSQLAATDLVIACRFHNILLALMLGKPVLAISYHPKDDALMASSGLAEFSQDIEQIDVEEMIQQFRKMEESAGHIESHLQQNAAACRAALDDQYRRIFNDYLT